MRAKDRASEVRGNPKENPKVTKVPKGSYKGETSKTGLSGLENQKSETSSVTQESAQTCPADTSCNDGWNCDEWNDGWSSVGWQEGWAQTCDTSASLFSLGSFDPGAMSSLKQFEWVKMNLDTGAAVNTFPLNFGPEGAGDGRFYRTAVVVNGFLMVELGSFKDTTKTDCSDL